MTKVKIIWTALPYGWTEDHRPRISVFVSPRLSNADASNTIRKLEEFPAFTNWPATLEGMHFQVEFDNGVVAEAIPMTQAEPEKWERLFPPDTPVKPHQFKDHAKRNLHVFPVREVLQFLEGTYGDLGAEGGNLPSIDDPSSPLAPFLPLGDIPNWIRDSQSFFEELERGHSIEKGDGKVVSESVGSYVQNTFFQAYRFYTRPGSQRPDFPEDYEEPPPDVPDFDFHQIVAQLADHPELMRQLGLVVDLVVGLDDPLSQVPGQGIVRVIPEGDLPEHPPTCPGTHYELDEEWFGARPQDDFRLWRGLLRLHIEFFDLFQVDVNGAAMQAVGFANTLQRLLDPERRGPDTPGEVGAPALRSAGLAVARSGRGGALLDDLKDRRDKNARVEAGLPVAFFAEDLIRGYRVDVLDQDAEGGPRWFSLHQRLAEHQLKDPADNAPPIPVKISDEGYLKATSASGERSDHPAASDDLYLHETIFGWEGWSLSAPRPGKRIVEPGEGEGGGELARYDPEQDNPHALVSAISAAQGTLPRLRIGHTYRMRARTVDLAGNSRSFSQADYESDQEYLQTDPERYLRFEPLPSPTVLRRHLDTEGESLEHLVIRSNYDQAAAAYAASPDVAAALQEVGAPHSYAEDSQRHLAVPKASQQMAEQDGRFDPAFGGSQAQINAALRTALREEGTFLDETIVDLTTGQKTVAQAPISLHPPGTTLPANRGDGLSDGAYSFYPAADVLLPYLPDPLAIGVSLTGYDFTGAEVFHEVALFPGEWPEKAPFRLRLAEAAGPPKAAFNNGVLEVTLPKAEVIRARLSSVFPDGRLEDLAIWGWIPDHKKTESLKELAVQGRHWMLTPFRIVTFTHAVQQPLQVPDSTGLVPQRSLGDTHATFYGAIKNHARSTGRLDLYGEWTEDVDLLTDDLPRMKALGTEVPYQAHAFGFEIGPGEDQAAATQAGPIERLSRHEFGDTKYRKVTYHSVATTRFREFFPAPIANDPDRIQRVEASQDEGGNPVAALVRHVPSTARPAAPEVLYVLPTFRWERQDEGEHRKHVRRGKAVRVWLARPWFSSGDGEQLAVVLEPGVRLPTGWRHLDPVLEFSLSKLARVPARVSFRPLRREAEPMRAAPPGPGGAGVSEFSAELVSPIAVGLEAYLDLPSKEEAHRMLRPYVTSWGLDPVWKSAMPERPPTVADFPRHAGYAAGLTLEELTASVKVVAAAHDVYYDPDRKLWYCDIEIDPGATYYPFVRLALARYQAHSLPYAHLSRVTMTDFIQLAPDRTAEVSLPGGSAEITVRGYAARNIVPLPEEALYAQLDFLQGPSDKPNTTMRAALERRDPGIPGDLGWERVGQEITLAAQANGFHVTWKGSLPLPEEAIESGDYRIVITEVETHARDLQAGDPMLSTSPRDFVRERIVYADHFVL